MVKGKTSYIFLLGLLLWDPEVKKKHEIGGKETAKSSSYKEPCFGYVFNKIVFMNHLKYMENRNAR